jgi:4-hydroxy-L-threonine phosphate dehydrogenase PdxA
MEIQEAKGITDLDLEMNTERPQMEAAGHAPTIHPAPAVPIVKTTAKAIQLRCREKPTLIAPPKKNDAPENAPKGPNTEAKETKAAKKLEGLQQQQKQQQRKPTYAVKAAVSAKGQNKEGEFQVVERNTKKVKKKELDNMAAIPTNKNTLENRRVTFKRNNTLPNFQKTVVQIVSAVNTVLHAARVPHHIRMGIITTNIRGTITALATPEMLAYILVV